MHDLAKEVEMGIGEIAGKNVFDIDIGTAFEDGHAFLKGGFVTRFVVDTEVGDDVFDAR